MPKFTGGIHSHDGTYSYHAFLSSGTFTKTIVENVDVDVLLVAGGGGGGGGYACGGGGAGGLLWQANVTISDNGGKTITIGGGGAGGVSSGAQGTNGANTTALGYTAIGGGGGANQGAHPTDDGKNGGSGGGASLTGFPGIGTAGTGTSGQGNAGGVPTTNPGNANNSGAGGGGKGSVGGNSGSGTPGAGGTGSNQSANVGTTYGESGWFASGGSGSVYFSTGGTTSVGGGGTGGSSPEAGVANTGGGGGGAGGGVAGGDGGSGIVILRYVELEYDEEVVATGPANIDVEGQVYTTLVLTDNITATADGPANIAIAGKSFALTTTGAIMGDTGLSFHNDLIVNELYTPTQRHDALVNSLREIAFRYELLDEFDRHKQWLPNVESCSIEHNMFREIKRTARFNLREDNTVQINWLRDRIKPHMYVKMPDDNWAHYPLGVFLLTSPQRSYDGTRTLRDVEAYDKSQILEDDVITDRYSVLEGTPYTDVVRDLLADAGINRTRILASDLLLPTTQEWEPGTSKLSIINSVLSSINYKSLWFDSNGLAIGERYRSLDSEQILYTYDDSLIGVLYPEAEISFDLFSVPNKWVIVVSQPDMPEMIAEYTNNSPDSPTSTINRGRTIVDFRTSEDDTPPTQEVLQAQVERLAESASQVYQHTEFSTSLMPIHGNQDVIRINYPKIGIDDRFVHTGWEMDLTPGGTMKHKARRVVVI